MKINKRNIITGLIIICAGVLFGFFWNLNQHNKFYNSQLTRRIEEIKSSRKFKNSKVAKFVGEPDFNYTFWIYAPDENDVKIGDSISKPKNSEEYNIYRRGNSGKYNFYKILKNKP